MNKPRGAGKRWGQLVTAVVLATALLNLTYPMEETSRRLGDLAIRLGPDRRTSSHVALVAIDDACLARLGRWPWNRALLARLMRQVSANHPAAIGLDIVFSEAGSPEDDRELV
jgi:CHASE2 domain-containing sensor protein